MNVPSERGSILLQPIEKNGTRLKSFVCDWTQPLRACCAVVFRIPAFLTTVETVEVWCVFSSNKASQPVRLIKHLLLTLVPRHPQIFKGQWGKVAPVNVTSQWMVALTHTHTLTQSLLMSLTAYHTPHRNTTPPPLKKQANIQQMPLALGKCREGALGRKRGVMFLTFYHASFLYFSATSPVLLRTVMQGPKGQAVKW